ncbi:hypothetical protein GCM10029992_19650 [Glycomyces albus]
MDGEQPRDQGAADQSEEDLEPAEGGHGAGLGPELGEPPGPGRAARGPGEEPEQRRGGGGGQDRRGRHAGRAQVRGAVGQQHAEDRGEHERKPDEDGRLGRERAGRDGGERREGRKRADLDHLGLDGGVDAHGEARPGDVGDGPDRQVRQEQESQQNHRPGAVAVDGEGVGHGRTADGEGDADEDGPGCEQGRDGERAAAYAAPQPHRLALPGQDVGLAGRSVRGRRDRQGAV